MANFDFITDDTFRESLSTDYQELTSCMTAKAWKAVHVLAGSIIEAVLTDYLVAIKYQNKSTDAILRMNLSDIITACKNEKLLTQKTADLSSVIREYRNLIHPGRAIRLDEEASEQTAKIAQALVEIIISEVSQEKSKLFGFTAEQLVTKIEQDPSAISILSHLLINMREVEIDRLLTRTIPQHCFTLTDQDEHQDNHQKSNIKYSLEQTFKTAFTGAPEDVKRKTAKEFIRILKEESERRVTTYEDTLFKTQFLDYLDPDEITMVKQHLLSRLSNSHEPHTPAPRSAMKNIGKFLTRNDIQNFVTAGVKAVTNADYNAESEVIFFLQEEYELMDFELRRQAEQILSRFIKRTDNTSYTTRALNALKESWDEVLPF